MNNQKFNIKLKKATYKKPHDGTSTGFSVPGDSPGGIKLTKIYLKYPKVNLKFDGSIIIIQAYESGLQEGDICNIDISMKIDPLYDFYRLYYKVSEIIYKKPELNPKQIDLSNY